MPNMSYCRFQNTLSDLRDCWDNMNDDDIGASEESAKAQLIKLCHRIVDNYGEDA